jgi:signal transduction histidine kinase
LLAQQTAQASGIMVESDDVDEAIQLSPTAAIGLYRIGQEALNNAVKHAEAQTIWIQLRRDKDSVILTVEDNGKGFVPEEARKEKRHLLTSKGLDNIQTRTRLLNGDLKITSKPAKGTRVSVKLTLSDA